MSTAYRSLTNRLRSSTSLTSAGLIAVIVVMVITLSILNPNFYSGLNLRNVARQTAILGITACGQTMVILSGGLPITDMSAAFGFLGAGQFLTLPIPAVIAAIVFIVCAVIMKKTVFGRHVCAIGGNEEAARYAGVPVAARKVGVWALHGGLVGLAAVVLTSRAVSGHATLGEGMELESIAAIVIGGTALGRGRGSIGSTFRGVVVMGILTNGLNLITMSTHYQMVLIGVIIAGAVYVDRLRDKKA